MSATKNLGFVKAIYEGLTAPVNIKQLWYDTNTGVNKLKYYDTTTSSWLFLNSVNPFNATIALTDASTIDIASVKNSLSTSASTRTFTISYTGDDITLEITLSATSSVLTFPITSLCVSECVASGDNTCSLSGVSGDKYIICIKRMITNSFFVICKNFGQ